MKIAHLADLHIGRRFGTYDLIEDQAYIFKEILAILKKEEVETLLITGDIYDKKMPSEAAFSLWNDFLTDLVALDLNILIISGNHDSAERLGLASDLLIKQKIYIAAQYRGSIEKVTLYDQEGPINFFLFPFIKPAYVRNYHQDFTGQSYQEAFDYLLKNLKIDFSQRNIALVHQFFIAGSQVPQLSESEVMPMLGGLDAIDISLFLDFDYVAMGHIHRPQRLLKESIRYAGSPLKYSFSEHLDQKSLPILDFKDKLTFELIPLKPMRDVIQLQGPYQEIIQAAKKQPSQDLIHINLTDQQESYNPLESLRVYYPNLVSLSFKRDFDDEDLDLKKAQEILDLDPLSMIKNFFKAQTGRDLLADEKKLINDVLEDL